MMREMRETREIRERERHNSIMKTDRHTDGQSDLLGSLQEPKTNTCPACLVLLCQLCQQYQFLHYTQSTVGFYILVLYQYKIESNKVKLGH